MQMRIYIIFLKFNGGDFLFNNKRFITRGISDAVPTNLQLLMWELIDETPGDKDYLQVFSLSAENGKQKIVHTQEVPEYSAEYVFDCEEEPITSKIFVIDDVTHATMLLASEY